MRKLLSAVVAVLAISGIDFSAYAAPLYAFPISGCSYTYARAHHNYPATDILTHIGCNFVAPTAGVIDEVNRVDHFSWKTNKGADRGGLSISMIGDDGVRYYGSHLSSIPTNIVPGFRVVPGDLLGKTGNSGDARGTTPHLHFGISWPTPSGKNIWWVRRGELYPWPFLDAWKAGKDLSPSASVAKLEKKIGEIPKQSGY
jgi:murein DD-endopeptidase MepM/ murein hydrolase activator NlpD